MSRPVIHHDGRFAIWTTVVDAPITMGMPADKMVDELMRRRSWSASMAREAIEVARTHGTTLQRGDHPSDGYVPLEALLEGNRAGPDESEIPVPELLARMFPTPKDGAD